MGVPRSAILLAAGTGSRLEHLTATTPKPMFPIQGKPILEHNLEWLRGMGVRDFYINLHHRPEVIRNHFGDGGRWGVRIRYSFEKELLGTSGAVRKICELFPDVDDPFLVVYGDSWYEFDLAPLFESHQRREAMVTIGLYEKEGDLTQSGVVALSEDGRVIRFMEKAHDGAVPSRLVNAGIYVMGKEGAAFIPEGVSDFGYNIFPEFLAMQRPLLGTVLPGRLIAIDTRALWEAAGT